MREAPAVMRFKTLEEFGKLASEMDDYRLLPIRTTYAERDIGSGKVLGMTNITKNRVTMACGPKYPVFGHREALGYVYSDLLKSEVQVHGHIQVLGDTSWSRIFFDGIHATDEDGKPVEMGVEFINPMDKKTKFKGHAYTWRQTCSNGAGYYRNFPGLEINESHTTMMNIVVPPMIHDFLVASLKQTDRMQQMINNAVKSVVSFNDRKQMVATLTGIFTNVSERHVRAIASIIDTLEPTRWQIFNAANSYTSHHASVSPMVREDIDFKAELLLDQSYHIIPAFIPPEVKND